MDVQHSADQVLCFSLNLDKEAAQTLLLLIEAGMESFLNLSQKEIEFIDRLSRELLRHKFKIK